MNENIDRILQEIKEMQARQDEQIKTLFNQQADTKKLTESVYDLAASVKLLAASQKTTEQRVAQLTSDVETVKQRPAKKWDELVKTALTVLVTAAVTYFLTRVGG